MDGQGYTNYIGIVQVPLANLHFIAGVGERSYNQRQTDHLERLFRGTSVNHTDRRHWIDGYIDGWVKKIRGGDTHVSSDGRVAYTQGRHRVEAAKNIDLSSCWTIRLYSTDRYSFHTNRIVKCRTEQYQHELTNSDGEIYSKLREYDGDEFNFCEWHERLSVSKKRAFFYITERPSITAALDRLIHLKGVMEFLQLTGFLKIFDQRLDDELLAGLEHVHTQWSSITSGSELNALDKDTVIALEGRAPAVSAADRNWIISSFKCHRVLKSIGDMHEQARIGNGVLAAHGLIHSLTSIHMNIQHLCVAASIIWSYLIPKQLRVLAKVKKMSLAATLKSCWAATESYVEIKEGVFQPAHGPPSFRLAYIQLMLSALRLFPYLTNMKPKVEKREKTFLSIDLHCVSALHKRARMLGFHTLEFDRATMDSMLHFSGQWCRPQTASLADEAELLTRPDHRWGRPYEAVYQIMQSQAFLPTIEHLSAGSSLSIAFILRDFISVFFGPCYFELDYSRSLVYLREETVVQSVWKQPTVYSLSTVALQPIAEATETGGYDFRSSAVGVGPRAADSDVSMHSIQGSSGPIVEGRMQLGHSPAQNDSIVLVHRQCDGVHGYSTVNLSQAEHAGSGQPASDAPRDICHTSDENLDSDIDMPDVETSLSLSSGTENGAKTLPPKRPQLRRLHQDTATSLNGVSCLEVQDKRVRHSTMPLDEYAGPEAICIQSKSPATAYIKAWRGKLSRQQRAPSQSSLSSAHQVLGSPRFSTSSGHSRSTILSSPRSDRATSTCPPGLMLASGTCSKRRHRRRRHGTRKHDDCRKSRDSTVPIRECLRSSPSRSQAISQMPLRPPQISQPSSGTSALFDGTVGWDGDNSSLSIPRSSSPYPAQVQPSETLGQPALAPTGNCTNNSTKPQPCIQLMSGSTSPRSIFPADCLPDSRDIVADDTLQLLELEKLHEQLQKHRGDGQRSSKWQGFDDSDDEMCSIEL